jgi:hypothetical protein
MNLWCAPFSTSSDFPLKIRKSFLHSLRQLSHGNWLHIMPEGSPARYGVAPTVAGIARSHWLLRTLGPDAAEDFAGLPASFFAQ